MDPADRLRSGLHDAAEAIDAGDVGSARAEVGSIVGRRRRRRAGAVAIGTAAVVVAGVTAIVWNGPADAPETLRSTDTTVPVSSTDTGAATTVATATAPSTTASPPTSTEPEADERPTTTVPTTTVPAPIPRRSAELAGVVGVPIDEMPIPPETQVQGGEVLPWRGGFLAISPARLTGPATAHVSTDGLEWAEVEFVLPEGLNPGRFVVGGDHLVAIAGPSARSGATVYSSTDLVNWSAATVEPVEPPFELPAFVHQTVRPWTVVANPDGWIVEASQGVRLDAFDLVPAEDRPDIEFSNQLFVEPDENGVNVVDTRSEATWSYRWDDLGVGPEEYEYIANGINGVTNFWAGTWEGDAVPTDRSGVPTDDGFVHLGGPGTRFSADGVTWTPVASPLPTETRLVPVSFGSGILVADLDDPSILYRLDAEGVLVEEVEIAQLPPIAEPYSWSGTSAIVYSATRFPQPLQILDDGEFRLSYDPAAAVLELVDLATGVVIVTETREIFEENGRSTLTWNDDGSITVIDLETEDVIVSYSADMVQQSMQDVSDAASQFVPDLHVFATTDGEEFLAVDLPEDQEGLGGYTAVANGRTVLVGVNGSWTRYELG